MIKKLLFILFPPKIIRVPSGIVEFAFTKNGKKYLLLTKVGEKGEIWRKRFLIKNLVDENWEVTDKTIEQEKEMFTELP